jgi:hypothetical protein
MSEPITLTNLQKQVAQEFTGVRDRIYETHTYILEKIPTLPALDLIKIAENLKIITPEQAQNLIRETEAIEPATGNAHPIMDA